MKGDFSRQRFNPERHYNRVLRQQGRVDLDADWNEQAAISRHLMRTLVVDLFGRRAGPEANCGFGLSGAPDGQKPQVGDFFIGEGRYYVDGLLVENAETCAFTAQPEWPGAVKLTAGHSYLAYLDVWERHVTWIEDDGIREVALGGPDTATRVKTTWQVKVIDAGGPPKGGEAPPKDEDTKKKIAALEAKLEELVKALDAERDAAAQAALKKQITALERELRKLKESLGAVDPPPPPAAPAGTCGELLKPLRDWKSGRMRARLEPSEVEETPCVLPPESRYRGLENHLYRIEVHDSGDTSVAGAAPTFKWSRENGSVAARWLGVTGATVRLSSTRGFSVDDWVEFSSEDDELLGSPGSFARVLSVDGDVLTVQPAPAWNPNAANPRARRWDQRANDELALVNGAVPLTAPSGEEGWIEIEDGIEVQFENGQYRSGDYWLLTARVLTGQIDWPVNASGSAMWMAPDGITHHYAELFMLDSTAAAPFVSLLKDCRCKFARLACIDDAK